VRRSREVRQARPGTARNLRDPRDRRRVAECARLVRGAALLKGDVVFAVPRDLDTPTRGYAYDKRMLNELRELGWRPEVLNLGDGFPRPSALTRAAANAHLHDVPKGRPIVVDGLAFGVLPEA